MYSNQVMPVANVICARRELKQQVDLLYENLKTPRGMCDITSPRKFAHLEYNAKKTTQAKARQEVIDHDNLMLMEKMAHIMLSKPVKTSTSFKPGTRLDNNQLPKIDNHNDYTLVHGYKKQRMRESKRIAKENAFYRKRIKDQKPTYSNADYVADNEARQIHLARMHRKLVWSKPTTAEIKQEEIRQVHKTQREESHATVYDSPLCTNRGPNIANVSSTTRNRMCICIDNFDPAPPPLASSGQVFPRTRPRILKFTTITKKTAIPSQSESNSDEGIDVILQENEELLEPCALTTDHMQLKGFDPLPPSAATSQEYEVDEFCSED